MNNYFIKLILNDLIFDNIKSFITNKDLHSIYKTTKLLLFIRQFCYWNLNCEYSIKYYTQYDFRSKLQNMIKNPNNNLSLDLSNSQNNIDRYILDNTHSVKFKWIYDEIIDDLPNSITHLILGDNFNQPINNLPDSVTHLILGDNFNQPLINLPNSLTHLILGDNFNQTIYGIPDSLKYFKSRHVYIQRE